MKISGWGRYPEIDANTCSSYSEEKVKKCISRNGSWISYAMGRSYGDSALNNQVLLTRQLNKIIEFDEQEGILTCESGVSLEEIIDCFLPRGWFLTVTPGTKHITVGGAIASDVHGKNHHFDGSFSACVHSFELMLGDGDVLTCSREKNRELFLATCGGMGLTGVIVRASVQLKKVTSAFINQKTLKARNLKEIFELFEEYSNWTYSVAWIDCLSKGSEQGRSLLMVGEHAEDFQFRYKDSKKLSIPFDFPKFALNKYSVALFNELYYRKARKQVSESTSTIDNFFYPLDSIYDWNRIYGKSGFLQYQFVLPKESSFKGLQKIISQISKSGLGSFLTVLKLFGPGNENYLSFPMEGYTLALDFKVEPKLFPMLNTLDKLVLDFNGRLYLTKDSRMSAEMLNQGYPELQTFKEIREKYNLYDKFNSNQSKRLGI